MSGIGKEVEAVREFVLASVRRRHETAGVESERIEDEQSGERERRRRVLGFLYGSHDAVLIVRDDYPAPNCLFAGDIGHEERRHRVAFTVALHTVRDVFLEQDVGVGQYEGVLNVFLGHQRRVR